MPPAVNKLIYWYWGHSDDEAANANQILGKYYNGTDTSIRIINCIENVMYGDIDRPESYTDDDVVHPGSDWVECMGYTIFGSTSSILAVLYIILLTIQLKKHGAKNWETYKKTKTIVFISAITQLCLIFIDNLVLPAAMHWLGTTLITAFIALLR